MPIILTRGSSAQLKVRRVQPQFAWCKEQLPLDRSACQFAGRYNVNHTGGRDGPWLNQEA